MGCFCCAFGSFISSLVYLVERISTCLICTLLLLCTMLTLIIACVFGVALGYHFCLVEHNARIMDKQVAMSEHNLRGGNDQPVIYNRVLGRKADNSEALRGGKRDIPSSLNLNDKPDVGGRKNEFKSIYYGH